MFLKKNIDARRFKDDNGRKIATENRCLGKDGRKKKKKRTKGERKLTD